MVNSNYINEILDTECIGDSLLTINSNFSSLDLQQFNDPFLVETLGINYKLTYNQQYKPLISLTPNNSLYFEKSFDYLLEAEATFVTLDDSISIPATIFKYTLQQDLAKPVASFTVPVLNNNVPKVSIYWTASGSYDSTVFALNSSSSLQNLTDLGFNGEVTTLHQVNNLLYVGGTFTTVGSAARSMFAVINLSGGSEITSNNFMGSLSADVLNLNGGLIKQNSDEKVNTIKTYGDYVIIGGSFKSLVNGCGLVIVDTKNAIIHPYYVNGVVNDIHIVEDQAYVVGEFDFVNVGSNGMDSNIQKHYTNGVARLSLDYINTDPNATLSDNLIFHEYIKTLFFREAKINAIEFHNNSVYLGGQFSVIKHREFVAKNLLKLQNDTLYEDWQPILNGPVYDLEVLNNRLYIGGLFSEYNVYTGIYNKPTINTVVGKDLNNICKLNIEANTPFLISNWKPRFNNYVSSIKATIIQDIPVVYCYGGFTTINEKPANFVISLNADNNTTLEWTPSLSLMPSKLNKALLLQTNGVIIGGNFTHVNSTIRAGLCKLSPTTLLETAKTVVWDIKAELTSPGNIPNLNNQPFQSIVTKCSYPFKSSNILTVSNNLIAKQPLTKGHTCRFLIKRAGGNQDTYIGNVYVLGYSVDFDK